MVIKIKTLIIGLIIPIGVGLLAGFISAFGMGDYDSLIKPAVTPPSFVFSTVWTILYILMGISSYIVYTSHAWRKKEAINIYSIQLIMNFMWPILFFNLNLYLVSAIWIFVLCILIFIMIVRFSSIKPIAGWLQIPYLLWTVLAAYLNISIYLLNR